jgi:phage FluMu protein Com
MTTIRCTACNKILYEAEIIEGTIRKKCKCGVWNIQTIKPASQTFQDRVILAKK